MDFLNKEPDHAPSYSRCTDQPAEPAADRRHEDPRDIGRLATFPRAFNKHSDRRRPTSVPDRPAGRRRSRAHDEQHRVGATLFFTQTLDRPDLARRLVRLSHPRNLPVVLSRDEVARLLNATTCLKHQAAISVAYGAGLRVAEVSMLKIADVDSERMLLRVVRGKGGDIATPCSRRTCSLSFGNGGGSGRQQGCIATAGCFPGSTR
ncbi:tyrosine-type recombinase/integrase [Mesorhizobium sp. M0488]|uniref:tyrosine-type recombinase/integrase n=1 Tax=unclassified Mesorhizobium TaxID=325217 RepID=UPI00333706A3